MPDVCSGRPKGLIVRPHVSEQLLLLWRGETQGCRGVGVPDVCEGSVLVSNRTGVTVTSG